jgi:hypothetical protein
MITSTNSSGSSIIGATQSTDTRLFFEVGTPEDTAKSQWGKKLKDKKLKRQQCGELAEGVLRMLLVNFAMADRGWPHFISGEKFGARWRAFLGSSRLTFDCFACLRIHTKAVAPEPAQLWVHPLPRAVVPAR